MITRDQFRTSFNPVDEPRGTEVVTTLKLQVSSFIPDSYNPRDGLNDRERRHVDSGMRMIYGDFQRAIWECRRNVLNRCCIPGIDVTGILSDFEKLRAMFDTVSPIDPITSTQDSDHLMREMTDGLPSLESLIRKSEQDRIQELVTDIKEQINMLSAGLHPSQRMDLTPPSP